MKNKIKLLDCTLRDGGYINDWLFGENNIQTVIYGLRSAQVDIIEIGYLSAVREFSKDSTQYADVAYANSILPQDRGSAQYVAMVDFGKLPLELLPDRTDRGLDGIRLAFHKRDRYAALEYAATLQKKGYDLFLQPMVTLNYSDAQFLELISLANQLQPKVFYVVDSFGAMKRDDLLHAIYLADYNLSDGIDLGFHSHNNLQLSYSHAQTLCNQKLHRGLVIDSSIHGMGRGAGNLNTELFAEYLNEFYDSAYTIKALLRIADNVIAPIYQRNYWGYSLPFYLSASHNCHPNYAIYLDSSNTLTAENINELFSMMDPDHKAQYDKEYIRELYLRYQSERTAVGDLDELQSELCGKEVLVIAPGKSILEEQKKIRDAGQDKLVIALNHNPVSVKADYLFVSNHRRWENMDRTGLPKVILTSNIRFETKGAYIVDYASLLNDVESVKDNAGMLLIAMLIRMKVKKVWLAGMDGYSVSGHENFSDPQLEFSKRESVMLSMNEGMTEMLGRFVKEIPIEFVTTPRHVTVGKNVD